MKIRYAVFGRLDSQRRRPLTKNFKNRAMANARLKKLRKEFPTRLKYARVKKIRVANWMS